MGLSLIDISEHGDITITLPTGQPLFIPNGSLLFDELTEAIRNVDGKRPVTTREGILTRLSLLSLVLDALKPDAKPFSWGAGTATTYSWILRGMGIDLVTQTAADKRGHVLKRGAKPIGQRYFNAPLQRYADLYVFGVQSKPGAS